MLLACVKEDDRGRKVSLRRGTGQGRGEVGWACWPKRRREVGRRLGRKRARGEERRPRVRLGFFSFKNFSPLFYFRNLF
jgi:hypothetical protein